MFSTFLEHGWIDSFRFKYPELVKYSWWSNRSGARRKNNGWRLDYFLVSGDSREAIIDARIKDMIFGSDHCPVEIDLDLTKLGDSEPLPPKVEEKVPIKKDSKAKKSPKKSKKAKKSKTEENKKK